MTRARRAVDAHARSAVGTRAMLAVGIVAVGLLGACASRSRASGAAATDAIVYLQSNVRDAQLYVDGRYVAPLDALRGGVALDPGAHRLELRHDDYFPSYLELQLGRAERKRIVLDLAAILP